MKAYVEDVRGLFRADEEPPARPFHVVDGDTLATLSTHDTEADAAAALSTLAPSEASCSSSS